MRVPASTSWNTEPGHWTLQGTRVQPICEGRRSDWRRPLGLSGSTIPRRIHSHIMSYLAGAGKGNGTLTACPERGRHSGLCVSGCVCRLLPESRSSGGREPVCASQSPVLCPSSWAPTGSSEPLLAGGPPQQPERKPPHGDQHRGLMFLSNVREAAMFCAVPRAEPGAGPHTPGTERPLCAPALADSRAGSAVLTRLLTPRRLPSLFIIVCVALTT